MNNDKNIYERLWKLWTMICKMIMDGTRDPEKVAEVLQRIVNPYLCRLFEKETIAMRGMNFHVYAVMEEGNYVQFFESLNHNIHMLSFDSLEDVRSFCHEHFTRLRADGYSTLFLFRDGDGCLVANVTMSADGVLRFRIDSFLCSNIFNARVRPRVIVPYISW